MAIMTLWFYEWMVGVLSLFGYGFGNKSLLILTISNIILAYTLNFLDDVVKEKDARKSK
jgi:hypothetical protein